MLNTRGFLNNNPGNIRIVPGTTWEGQSPIQTDGAFVQFTDPVYGIRAIARILMSYARRGINTIQAAINRWAPPNENNSQAYVTAVCASCNLKPLQNVSLTAIMPQLIAAIILHENGEQPYTEDQINQGITLAQGVVDT